MIMRSANVPAVAFVRIADDVFPVGAGCATVFHLMPVGKTGAAATAQTGCR